MAIRQITITINEKTEDDNIWGWVNAGYADPAFAQHPTKIVLEERTYNRWNEIAQFYPKPSQPPIDPPSTNGQFIGELPFDGKPTYTQNLKGQPFSYCKFVIPSGLQGKVSQIVYAEYHGYGGQQFTKQVSFSKTVGDFSTIRCLGASGNLVVSFENELGGNTVCVRAGEVWYMNFVNKRENGEPSASESDNGNFMITPAFPS